MTKINFFYITALVITIVNAQLCYSDPLPLKTKTNLKIKTNIGQKNDAIKNKEFSLTSTGIKSDGSLSIEYTGEGKGISMPLKWTNPPKGTKVFAINLWHLPHPSNIKEVKSYWILYNIPSHIKKLPKNVKTIGTFGYNDKNRASYDPMKSKGPGAKEYNLTIYALSEKLKFQNNQVYRVDLLKAIKEKILGETTLKYTYATGKNNKFFQPAKNSKRKRPEDQKDLTKEQKTTMKEILSRYNPATLSNKDALEIHKAFREVGLRGGPSSEQTIKEAGFSPVKLKELAPPQNDL